MARIQGGTQTRSGVVTGSLAHAAPEVLSGQPATEASDVYSLASTLYALAAGHGPFVRPGDGPFHPLLTRIMSEAPPDLRAQGLPAPLWGALAAALAKDPSRRTSSARAFGDALRSAQRAMGLAPTRMVVPDAVATPFVTGPAAAGDESVTGQWARPRPAAVVAAPPGPVVPRRGNLRPAWLAAAVLGVFAVLAIAALALTSGDDGDDDEVAAVVPSTTMPVDTTTAPGPTTTRAATTPPTGATATTARPVTPAPTPTNAPGAPGTTAPAGAIPACAPSFFRSTVTSDRPSYRNGETVQVTARFENVSGRACSYSSTNATSQVFNPAGEPLTPVRALPGSNPQGIPFEPGTSQTFSSSWETAICASPSVCFPGRYSMAMDVAPFGGGRVSFDVA